MIQQPRSLSGLVAGCLSASLLVLALAPSASAQTMKMATLSPENSPWDTILKKMGKSWEENTAGRVSLTIIPGGAAGDEPDIIRKMRIGSYQAGAISVAGLTDIDDYFTIFEVPMFFDSLEEMLFVLNELDPVLRQRLDEKGFVLLAWGYVGWVHFFTSKPITTLADLQGLKIMSLSGDQALMRWWRNNGFKPVSLATTDIMMGLETGMIEAISVPPLFAMQMQYYKQAPHMADLGLAPMMGAVVLSKRAWNRMDAGDRAAVLAAGKEAEAQVLEQIPKLDEMAIRLMGSQGLEVSEIRDGEHSQEWVEAATRFAETMRGGIVPVEIFDRALAARTAFRDSQKAGDAP